MTDSPSNVHIVVPQKLWERLQSMKRPHQSFAGVIEELLTKDGTCTDPDTMKRLERYRTHARETVADLISNALDQLDELEKTLTKR